MVSLVRDDPTPKEVKEVEQISTEFQQAQAALLKAGQAFACISQQIAELQEELMQAAIDMHTAKCQGDKAIAAVREKARLI